MTHHMTKPEREEFLAGLHVGVIGVNDGDTSLAVPIWYGYEPGGEVTVITNPASIKGRALEDTRRFSLCAQDESLPYKYVTVEGPVTSIEDGDDATRREMAYRYLGQEFGDAYLTSTPDQSGDRIYRMTPDRWYTVDYAKDLQA